jgi:hypothetical protein
LKETAENRSIFDGLGWSTKIDQFSAAITFGGYFCRRRRKFDNRQKLFGPIFGGYAQAVENITDIFLAGFFIAVENYSVSGVPNIHISILHQF